MTKIIEQRARELQRQITQHKDWGDVHYGYVQGATDQRRIDIEKACEIYRKELSDIIGIFNRLGKELYNINELGELISLEGSIKDFKKAMEG